jgi:hypothetical protein
MATTESSRVKNLPAGPFRASGKPPRMGYDVGIRERGESDCGTPGRAQAPRARAKAKYTGEIVMIGAFLSFVVVLGQVPDGSSECSTLVARLGSARYAEREAAEAALERLGRAALPALRASRDSRDPEVRSRAAALIQRIEGALLTQPTLIALDFTDRSLPDVLKSIGDQAGIKLAIFPDQVAIGAGKTITWREPAPLPFWKALDRLCQIGQLQYNLSGMHGFPANREAVFPLFVGTNRPQGPISDDGPFRINLVSLHYQRDVSFVAPSGTIPANRGRRNMFGPPGDALDPGHVVNEQFTAQLQIAAEPRLSLTQNGPLRVLEAVDDQGQSLLLPSSGGPLTQRYAAYFGMTAGSTFHLPVPLRRPEHPGKTILKLRGVLPVMVATRKPNPLVIPLTEADGKAFHNDEVTLNVDDVRTNPNSRQMSIELTIQPAASTGANAPAAAEFGAQRPETYQQQIEVVDAQGRPIPWYHSSDAEGSRMTMTLTPHNQGAPTELRYYAMAKAATEVDFAFTNLPMP